LTAIINDFSVDAVVEAMAANNAGFVGMFDNAAGVEFVLEGGVSGYMTGIPFPLFNGVTETILGDEEADLMIARVIGKYKEKKMPMIWSITPLSRPRDLGQRLEAHGLQHAVDSPSMAVDIEDLPEYIKLHDGFSIEQVADSTALQTWCDILARIFRFPAFVGEALFNFMAVLGYDPEAAVRNYIGRADGKAVAVSTLLLSGGVAGIYNVGTIAEARRRGCGRAITLMRLLEARESGDRIGVLQSTEMGQSVYSRLGFKEYCTFSRYLWLPESTS